MGFRDLKKSVKVILIVVLVCSVTISGIFLGRWINLRKDIEIIEIKRDSDFYWKYNFPGKGTKEEPYIIEGYTLQGVLYGIKISGVTKHFIIQNCRLSCGIKLSNITADGTIVIKNNLIGGDIGISISYLEKCLITNNSFDRNYRQGIEVRFGTVNITSNRFYRNYNDGGVELYMSNNSRVEGNIFQSCDYGITLSQVDNVTVQNNYFTNTGSEDIDILTASNVIVENNTIENGNYGIGILDCVNIRLLNNNITNNSFRGIGVYYSNNCTIIGNNCTGSNFGLLMVRSKNSCCQSNAFKSNREYGIAMLMNDLCTITNNSCFDNTIGMSLRCSNITAINFNILEHNEQYGIETEAVNATIWNNNFIDNNYNNITEIHSQARVEGNCSDFVGFTKWFDEETDQGNYWSELVWFPGVEYIIDPGNYTDKYPIEHIVEIKIF